jgi:hypothetical protein
MSRVMPLPTEGHRKAMRERGDSFGQFARNRVWGTCCDCPRDTNNRAYPEFCGNALRSDHTLDGPGLMSTYSAHSR